MVRTIRLYNFFQGETYQLLNKIGISRIHFAFLDAQHKYDEVKAEFEFVSLRQKKVTS